MIIVCRFLKVTTTPECFMGWTLNRKVINNYDYYYHRAPWTLECRMLQVVYSGFLLLICRCCVFRSCVWPAGRSPRRHPDSAVVRISSVTSYLCAGIAGSISVRLPSYYPLTINCRQKMLPGLLEWTNWELLPHQGCDGKVRRTSSRRTDLFIRPHLNLISSSFWSCSKYETERDEVSSLHYRSTFYFHSNLDFLSPLIIHLTVCASTEACMNSGERF